MAAVGNYFSRTEEVKVDEIPADFHLVTLDAI
jgi:hypothetical protein